MEETFEAQLDLYCSLLVRWNQSINLIARSTIQDLRDRHIRDCLQIVDYIPNKDSSIVDLGSGSGLPGVVLAIAGFGNLTLVESDLKKCTFLKEVRRQLGLSYEVLPVRIETVKDRSFDVIVSRALTSTLKLLEFSEDLLVKDGKALFLKGQNVGQEILEAQKVFQFEYLSHPSKTYCEGHVLEVKNISRKSAKGNSGEN